MHYIYYIVIFTFILLSGCEYETDSPIPGYLTINTIGLNHENAIGITDAWVYVDDNIQGVYELPAYFPVIAEGESKITILPGIKVNGISGTRSFYPFYEPYEINIDFNASDMFTLTPTSEYSEWVQLIKVDDFEQGTVAFESSSSSDTSILLSTDAFEGAQSGKICLDTVRSTFEAYTIEQFTIPDFNDYTGMFLELNYKCDEEIEVGLIVNEPSTVKIADLIYLYPTISWKKIYIDLYNPLISYPEGYQMKIYLAAELSEGRDKAEIFVDDMKIVHK